MDITLLSPNNFPDYELLDSGYGQRLERFGKFILVRPDPEVLWQPRLESSVWEKADARYIKTEGDKGKWLTRTNIPDKWLLKCKNISFYCKLTPFKHTGLFPEQAPQWDFIQNQIQSAKKEVNVLNLFAYTGIASLVAASAGAKVTHIDASYPTIGWARENQQASGLINKPIRWILDDAIKFCQREVKRGVKYDGIIMDPPKYGHGPKGERWDFTDSFPELMKIIVQTLSCEPLFVLINTYAISASSISIKNVLEDYLSKYGGKFEAGELVLKETSGKRLLSTGIFARWSSNSSKSLKSPYGEPRLRRVT